LALPSLHPSTFLENVFHTCNMTITVVVSASVNETKFQCKTAGSDGNLVSSNVAWLWVAGT